MNGSRESESVPFLLANPAVTDAFGRFSARSAQRVLTGGVR